LKFGSSCYLLAFLSVCFLARPVFADVSHEGRQVSCLYDLNVDFLYLTEAKNLSKNKSVADPATSGQVNGSDSRYATFGLQDAAMNLKWTMPRGVAFEMILRPDATASESSSSGTEPVRELDTRSGRVVEPMPTVHLLDEYRLIFRRTHIEGRVGVERESLDNYRVTPELLGFGMRVRGPEKSFAGSVGRVHSNSSSIDLTDDLVFLGNISVLSGRSDRHDSRISDSGGLGDSPAKRDPYWGGAANVSSSINSGSTLGLGYALTEERQNEGHTRLTWYQLGLKQRITAGADKLGLAALEVRQLHQTFQTEGTDISDVTLSSIGLTSFVPVISGQDALIGVLLGRGTLHPPGVLSQSTGSSSYQVEFGWRWQLEDQLQLTSFLSREWRRDGTDTGGYIRGSSTQSTQSRFALQIQYNLGGQVL
jgi:hypothetical protein